MRTVGKEEGGRKSGPAQAEQPLPAGGREGEQRAGEMVSHGCAGTRSREIGSLGAVARLEPAGPVSFLAPV